MLRQIPSPISIRIYPAVRARAKRDPHYAESRGLANAILAPSALIASHIASPLHATRPDPLLGKYCDGGWAESQEAHRVI